MKKVYTSVPDEIRHYLKKGYKVESIAYFVDSISPDKYHFTLFKPKND